MRVDTCIKLLLRRVSYKGDQIIEIERERERETLFTQTQGHHSSRVIYGDIILAIRAETRNKLARDGSPSCRFFLRIGKHCR